MRKRILPNHKSQRKLSVPILLGGHKLHNIARSLGRIAFRLELVHHVVEGAVDGVVSLDRGSWRVGARLFEEFGAEGAGL